MTGTWHEITCQEHDTGWGARRKTRDETPRTWQKMACQEHDTKWHAGNMTQNDMPGTWHEVTWDDMSGVMTRFHAGEGNKEQLEVLRDFLKKNASVVIVVVVYWMSEAFFRFFDSSRRREKKTRTKAGRLTRYQTKQDSLTLP